MRRTLNYTAWIIIANILFFVILFGLSAIFGEGIFSSIALKPSAILQGKNLWTLATSMFMHAGLAHLFVNMISLFFIGTFLEKIIGKRRFLIFYIAAGIFAGIFFVILAGFFGNSVIGGKIFGSPDTLAVGASGAIFGLLGILAILTPYNRVFLIAGPLFAIIAQVIIDSIFNSAVLSNILNFLISAYIIASIFLIFSFNKNLRKIAIPVELPFWLLPIVAIVPLIVIGLFVELPIGNMAHLGGLIAGLIYGLYLKNKYPKRAQLISRIFSKR